jgi:hypothetical protein
MDLAQAAARQNSQCVSRPAKLGVHKGDSKAFMMKTKEKKERKGEQTSED